MTGKLRGGDLIRRALAQQGLTQQDLASEVGACQQSVSAWILGRPMSFHFALLVSSYLNIPIEKLEHHKREAA
jgi:transcriptional regulator with XRE-family HTH domain